MNSNGCFIIVYKGVHHLMFNKYAYPSELGESLKSDLQLLLNKKSMDDIHTLLDKMKWLDETSPPPTENDIKALEYLNMNVCEWGYETSSTNTWNDLLQRTRGQLYDILLCGYCQVQHTFIDEADVNKITDDKALSYTYIINFDTMEFNGRCSSKNYFWCFTFSELVE